MYLVGLERQLKSEDEGGKTLEKSSLSPWLDLIPLTSVMKRRGATLGGEHEIPGVPLLSER